MRKIAAVLAFVALPLFAGPAEDFNAGKAALEAGEHEKAAGFFEKAVAAKPNDANYHYYLGAAYGQWAQQAGMLKAASLAKKTKAELERAVKLDPKHWEARFGLIAFYMQAPGFMGGGEDKALAQAAEMKKLDLLEGHRAYARIYRMQKKPDLARKEMIDLVRAQPNSGRAHFYLGGTYMNEKNWPAAMQEFEQAAKLDPTWMQTFFYMGYVAVQSNTNYPHGEAMLRKYLAYKPADNEVNHASAWYYLGQVLEKQGKKQEAKQAYQAALKLNPKSKEFSEALKRVS